MITNAIIPSFEGVIAFILGWIITGFYDKTVIDKKKKYLHKILSSIGYMFGTLLIGKTVTNMLDSNLMTSVYLNVPYIITILILMVISMTDICKRITYTLPIYLAILIILVLKCIYLGSAYGIMQIVIHIGLLIIYGFACYIISKFGNEWIGEGDVDIYFLINLTIPLMGLMFAIASLILIGKHKLIEKINNKLKLAKTDNIVVNINLPAQENSNESCEDNNISIPFVPVMYLIYIICIAIFIL